MILLERSKQLIGPDYTAYLMILISNVFWVFGFMFGSESPKLDFVTISRWRGIGTVAMNALICMAYGHSCNFSAADFWTLIVRNVLSVFHGLSMATAFRFLPAPVVHTIANSGPIIVYLIDYFKNGVAITRKKVFGIFATTLTLVITINSSLIMYWLGLREDLDSKYHYIESSSWTKAAIGLLLNCTLVGWAYGIVVTKDLKQSTVPQINLHLGLMNCFVTGLICFLEFPGTEDLAIKELLPLTAWETLQAFVLVGLFLSVSSLLYIASVRTCSNTGAVTLLNYSCVVYAYCLSIFRYGEQPNIVGVLGSCGVLLGLFLVLWK